MAKVLSTKDYDIFKKHENNRDIDPSNLRKIIASIQAQNMLEFRPVLVDSKMRIIDGQHRLEAAKKLGYEVFYQINEESSHEDIALLNTAQKRWQTQDYLNYYASLGKTAYSKLMSFCSENNVTVPFLIAVLRGDKKHHLQKLKSGTFTLDDISMDEIKSRVKQINDGIALVKRYVIKDEYWMISYKFKCALLSFFKNPEVDFAVLERKVAYKADCLHACADVYGYYTMIRDVYNWKNANPIGQRFPEEAIRSEIAG